MKRLRLLLAGLSFVAVMASPSLASADVNNFKITNFNSDQTLSQADPQGELRIIEKINVTFTDYNHGILRAIPNSYKGHSLQLKMNSIKSSTGAPTQYTTSESNSNTVYKIGDPRTYVKESQEYTLDYTVRNVISFYNGQAELYWDVNGDQWQQTFSQVSMTLHLPEGLPQSRPPVCYTGRYDSNASDCVIASEGNTITARTTQPLTANQTLTYVAGFEPGYFHPSKWYETIGEHIKPILEFALPIIIIGGGSIWYWWSRGRDPKGRGTIIPEYSAPDGLKPMATGGIINFKVGTKDITATIIDLAVRGYIKIIETKEVKALRKDRTTYALELVNSDFTALDNNEKTLMAALFSGVAAGNSVDVSALSTKLYKTAKALNETVEAELATQGYFKSNPLKSGNMLKYVIGAVFFVIVFGAWHIIGVPGLIGLIIGGIFAVLSFFASPSRTVKGVETKEHILGLKMYLNVAEKDRIEKLQGPDAKYAEKSNEPVKTVELFEKLLPYAMVLGVEKQWAGKFEQLYTSPPDWYNGNWTTFNSVYLAYSLNEGIGGAVTSAFSAPSSSSSSGFGGGGFSGGGGGGGGGGGW